MAAAKKRIALIPVGIAVAAVAVALGLGGGSSSAPAAPAEALSRADAQRLRDRVVRSASERQGVHVAQTSLKRQGGTWCVTVGMLNPTVPNRRWLRQTFGPNVCPSARPVETYGRLDDICPPGAGAEVKVPDVVGLNAYQAAVRLRSVELSIGCHREFETRPSRYSPKNALVVEGLCEATARAGGSVHLRLRGTLPGGYRFAASDCVEATGSGPEVEGAPDEG